jgi:hypothetical protein
MYEVSSPFPFLNLTSCPSIGDLFQFFRQLFIQIRKMNPMYLNYLVHNEYVYLCYSRLVFVVVGWCTDSDYESSAEYESHARKYNDILRSAARKTSSTDNTPVATQGGTPSYMNLWCEMPKVIELSFVILVGWVLN